MATTKAYELGQMGKALEVDSAGTVTMGGELVVSYAGFDSDFSAGGTFADNVSFADGIKAQFGDGSDLQIYHSGSHSFIDDVGQGNLYVRANNLTLGKYTGEAYITTQADGNVVLYHDNNSKLATTATGISVTGTISADSATIPTLNGNISIVGSYPNMTFKGSDGIFYRIRVDEASNKFQLGHTSNIALELGNTGNTQVNYDLNVSKSVNIDSDLTVGGVLYGPSTMYIDPAPVDSDAGVLVIRGDLQVDGTTTTINSTVMTVDDRRITLARDAINATFADGGGIELDGANASILYDATDDEWDFNKGVTAVDYSLSNGTKFIDNAGRAYLINIQNSNPVSFLNGTDGTSGSGAQGINVRHMYAGTTYANSTAGAGDIEAANNFKLAGNIVIDSDRSIFGSYVQSSRSGVAISKTQSTDNAARVEVQASGSNQASVDLKNGNLWSRLILDNDDLFRIYNQTSSFNALAVKSSGDMGIGTDSPIAKLDVRGEISAGDGSSGTAGSVVLSQRYQTTNTIASLGTMYSSGGWLLGYGMKPKAGAEGFSSTFDNFSGRRAGLELTNNALKLHFAPSQQTSVDSDVTGVITPFYFDLSNQRLGIGTESPSDILTIHSTANDLDILSVRAGGSNNSQLTLGGFDANKSDLNGLVNGSKFGSIIQGGQNGHLVLGIRDNDVSDALDIVSGSGSYMSTLTYNKTLATFRADGKVGINTNNPQYPLHVRGPSVTTMYVNGPGGAGSYTRIQAYNDSDGSGHAGGAAYLQSWGWSMAKLQLGANAIQQASGQLQIVTSNQNTYWNTGSGKIGINTSSAQGKVHIYNGNAGTITTNGAHDDLIIEGSDNTGINIFSPNTSYQYLAFGDPEASNSGYVRYYHGTNQMVLRSGGADTVYINDGKVGIGSGSPAYKLDIVGSTARLQNTGSVTLIMAADTDNAGTENDHPEIRFTQDGTHNMLAVGSEGTGGHSYTGTLANSAYVMGLDGHGGNVPLHLGTNNTVRMTLDETGKVGIGTTDPFSTLHVYGTTQDIGYALPNLGSAAWYKVGTIEDFYQGGYEINISFTLHSGYNADNYQDYSIELFMKTSNGSSTNTDGAYFNTWYYKIGNSGAQPQFKWVRLSGTNNYELYVYLPQFANGSYYKVNKTGGTWKHGVASATDPGANSALIQAAVHKLNFWGDIGIGTGAPEAAIHIAGNGKGINLSGGNNRITFTGYRALEGNGNGTNLQIGEGYSSTRLYNLVGIGTAANGVSLEVYSPTTNVTSRFTSGDEEAWISLRDSTAQAYGTLIGRSTNEGRLLKICNDSVNERFLIDEDGRTTIRRVEANNGHYTFLQLWRDDVAGDTDGSGADGSFIDFTFTDANTNNTPQLSIGAELGNRGQSDAGQTSEGRAAFVVKTNDGGAGGLAEQFRVHWDGYIQATGTVVNTTYGQSSATTSVSTTADTVLGATAITVSAKGIHSNYMYHCVISSETDITATNKNGFFRLQYSINGGAWTTSPNAINMSGVSDAAGGTANNAVMWMIDPGSVAKGGTIAFRVLFSKSDAANITFNQQSLASQPSGSSNVASVVVQEIGL